MSEWVKLCHTRSTMSSRVRRGRRKSESQKMSHYVRQGRTRLSMVRIGQTRSTQLEKVKEGQERSNKVRHGQIRSYKINGGRKGQTRSRKIRKSQAMSDKMRQVYKISGIQPMSGKVLHVSSTNIKEVQQRLNNVGKGRTTSSKQ